MRKSNSNELVEWIKYIVIAAVFLLAVRAFIFTPIIVDGASMMPTYEDGDRLIVNKISKQLSDFERFDVIVFEARKDTNYIKRIIGLPGEHVAYKDDVLYINGSPLEEGYLDLYKEQLLDKGTLTQDFTLEDLTGAAVIPEGYLFVLGDNRRYSSDSRDTRLGLVPIDAVLGEANIRFYPFGHIGIVK